MKSLSFLFFCLFLVTIVSAQEVVSTQGDSYSNSSGIVDFTIGEVVINTLNDGSNDLTQGFHQTNWTITSVEDISNYNVSIFPNPTDDVINVKTSVFEGVYYVFYDINGKLLKEGNLTSGQTPIDVSQFAAGSYILTLNNKSENLKKFKLIKQN